MATVHIETNLGNISFKLLPELAPETVRNFEKLSKDGFMMEHFSTELFQDL